MRYIVISTLSLLVMYMSIFDYSSWLRGFSDPLNYTILIFFGILVYLVRKYIDLRLFAIASYIVLPITLITYMFVIVVLANLKGLPFIVEKFLVIYSLDFIHFGFSYFMSEALGNIIRRFQKWRIKQ